MKVEIKILPDINEPYAVICTNRITPEIRYMMELLEKESSGVIPVTDDNRIIACSPDEIYMVRVEKEQTAVYVKNKRYSSKKRLYEFETVLGNQFMRISKSTLVNLEFLDYVEPTFGGLMLLVLKNGCKDYISRKYLPSFKQYLGI